MLHCVAEEGVHFLGRGRQPRQVERHAAEKGAAIGGRIVRIRQFYGAAPSVRLEFRLETVDVGGVSLPLVTRPENGNNFPKADPANLQRRIELGNLRGLQDRSVEFVFRGISQPYVIQSGLESGWVTAAR